MLIDNLPSTITYEYTGVRTFSVTFPFYGTESISAMYRENDSVLTAFTPLRPGIDFTVTGVQAGAGDSEIAFKSGTLTLTNEGVARLQHGYQVLIARVTPITQQYAYNEFDNFPAKSHENALGRLTAVSQELAEKARNAVTIPPGSEVSGEDVLSDILDSVKRSTIEADRSASEADRSAVEADRSAVEADRSAVEADRSAVEADRSAAEAVKAEIAAAAAGRDMPLKICWIAGQGLPGHVTLSNDNGIQLRSAYPTVWPLIEEYMDIRSEAEWQAAFAASKADGTSGAVGFFSAGDGSTTFRFPLLRNVYVRSEDIPAGVLAGTYQTDQLQGHSHNVVNSSNFGFGAAAAAGNTTLPLARTTDIVTDGVNGTPRIGKENRPKTIVLTPIMKVVDVVINPSLLLSDNFVRGLNAKLDLARYEADFAAGAPFAPSSKYIDVAIPNSGNYTAPADGYFSMQATNTAVNQYMSLNNATSGIGNLAVATVVSWSFRTFVPASKGDVINIGYSTPSTIQKFVYANWVNRR